MTCGRVVDLVEVLQGSGHVFVATRRGARALVAVRDWEKKRFGGSDVSVLTSDSDEGERVERVGASLGGA